METKIVSMRLYCPKCGEWCGYEISFYLMPGNLGTVICPNCDTTWKLEIKFYDISYERNHAGYA